MSESHRAVIARMSYDLAAISAYLNRVSADLGELNRTLGQTPAAAPPPVSAAAPAAWPTAPATPAAPVDSPVVPARPVPAYGSEHSEGWVGRALAVAGVAVTLTGVVLLLVLAAQAG
ncbi:DUF2339 domain-containing protein, partial [Mycolicibacterium fortuitum]